MDKEINISNDSNLYKDFHKYINTIQINNEYFKKEDLSYIDCLKSVYCMEHPRICIHKYVDNILLYIYKDDVHLDGLLLTVIIIIKRIMKNIIINDYNIHKLLSGILLISHKVYYDIPYYNKDFAIISGITITIMNLIEKELLEKIDYNTFIKHEEMITVVKSIKYLQ